MPTASPIASLAGVTKIYGDGDTQVTALADADLSVYPGEILLIEGPSGSGKTTLISILGLLMRPTRGDVFIRGERVSALRERDLPPIRAGAFGFVFQGFNLFPALTAQENVELALRLSGRRDARTAAREALSLVGLADRRRERVSKLSGGERQRVAIASAIANRPQVLLADEITGELDSASAAVVLDALDHLVAREGTAVLAVTHNPEAATRAARRIDMVDGQIVSGGVS